MLLGENITMAINSIVSNKMRAFLTMLGIIIGIGSVIAIFTVGNSLTQSVETNLQTMGANDVYVNVSSKSDDEDTNSAIDGVNYGSSSSDADMTDADYITGDMIREMCDEFSDEIYAVNISHSAGAGVVSVADETANVSLMGTSAGYYVTNDLNILAGTMFSAQDFDNQRYVCMVSNKLVDSLFAGDYEGAIGQTIDISVDGKSIALSIVGVYKDENMMMFSFGGGGSSVYLPLKTAMAFDHSKDQYSSFQVSTKVGADPDALSGEIKSFFAPYYRSNKNYEVTAMTFESMLSMLTSMLDTITMAISIIAGIALLVGGIGVMNIMLVSVTERTREIGTRKALGAKNSSIRAQFIVEAMIICLIGGLIGLIFGIVGGTALSNYLGYPASPSIGGILVSIIFSMSIGLFFGYFPANKAAKMNPIDALRYE